MRRKTLLPLLALILTLAAAAPAAALEWRPGSLVTPPFAAVPEIQAGVDHLGNTLAVWQADGSGTLLWRERPRGRSFDSPPEAVAPGTGDVQEPILAMNAAGEALVAFWSEASIWVARKPAGQPFQAPQRIAAGVPEFSHIVADVGGNGEAVVAWSQLEASDVDVQAAVRRGSDAGWEDPRTFEDGSRAEAVALDGTGNGVLVYTTVDRTLAVARHAAGGAGFEPRQVMPNGGAVTEVDLDVDPATGRTVLAWGEAPDGTVTDAHTTAALGTTTAGLGAPAILSGPFARDVDVAVGDATDFGQTANAAVTWRAASGRRSRVQAAYSAPGFDRFTDTQSLSGRNARLPRVALANGNIATVAWQRLASRGRVVETSRRDADDEEWSGKRRVSTYGGEAPSITTGGRGDTYVAWTRQSRGLSRVESVKSSSSGRWSRVLTVFDARIRLNERVDSVRLFRSGVGALAIYRRVIPRGSRIFWDLATYHEQPAG